MIPQGICEDLKLAAGDFVAIEKRSGAIVIRPQQFADRDDTLTAREAAAVRRGRADIKAGNTVDWQQYRKSRALGSKPRLGAASSGLKGGNPPCLPFGQYPRGLFSEKMAQGHARRFHSQPKARQH